MLEWLGSYSLLFIKVKMKIFIAILLLFFTTQASSQKFSIGDPLSPTSAKFQLLGISSTTSVSTYKYIGTMTD